MEAAGQRWIVYGSRSAEFTFWSLADFHLGARACRETHLRHDIQVIAEDDYALAIGCGDYSDLIGTKDKRFDARNVDPSVKVEDLASLGDKAMEWAEEVLSPIKHKLVGLLYGNHELKFERTNERAGLHHKMCDSLKVADLKYSAIFDLNFVRMPRQKKPQLVKEPPKGGSVTRFRVYAHHGKSMSRTPSGRAAILTRLLAEHRADIVLTSHAHSQAVLSLPIHGANANCDELVTHNRVALMTGAYLDTIIQGETTYSEEAAYPMGATGAARVLIKPSATYRQLQAITG